MGRKMFVGVFLVMVVLFNFCGDVEARYLPTRGNGDKLDKLRELLKELLETEIENNENYDSQPRWHPESRLFYKREASAH
nr:uncharacterized protein LOC111419748 [Onthophagus taurus]